MKHLFIITLAVLGVSILPAFQTSNVGNRHMLKDTAQEAISWLDFESGFAKAQKEKKMLLVDVYTNWCYWCKVMDKETYTDADIIKKINEHFVTVKLNPEIAKTYKFGDTSMSGDQLHKWLGYGETFGYPTTYFMISPGKSEERYAQMGYMEPAEFTKILDLVLEKKKK